MNIYRVYSTPVVFCFCFFLGGGGGGGEFTKFKPKPYALWITGQYNIFAKKDNACVAVIVHTPTLGLLHSCAYDNIQQLQSAMETEVTAISDIITLADWVRVIMLNATFNNISALSWW